MTTILGMDSKNQDLHYKIGYVPEKENFPNMTAWNFLIQMSEFFGMDKIECEKRIQHYADVLELGDKLKLALPKMSSGQRKRIMIIQALINDPEVLIMDEPTENLDPDNRFVFYKILDELKKQNKTMFISTHNLAELEDHADHVCIIAEGCVKYEGLVEKDNTLREVYNKYRERSNYEKTGNVLYKDTK
jgi:ABC-2 type transport system ATP-binding protein